MFQAVPAESRRRAAVVAGAAAATLALAGCGALQGGDGASSAEGFPTQSIELTVPYAPGGSSDRIARALAQELTGVVDQSVVVTNMPGGGGVVGARDVLGSDADGYRIVLLSKSQFTISPLVESESNVLDFDELRLISGLTTEEYALVVRADSPYETLDDLLESDERISFSHSGVGTGTHYSLEVLFEEAGVDATGIPFDGSSPSITALLGGQVQASGGNIAEVMPQIEAGDLWALATFSAERSEFLPDVPTALEAGYDIVLDQRRVIAAPADLPDQVADALETAISDAEEAESYQSFLEDNYIAYWGADPDETEQELMAERDAIAAKTEELGIDFGSDL